MKDLVIGVDVGTTGTKAMLVAADGKVVAESYVGYPLHRPGPLMVEQDAESWWDAVVQTVRSCTRSPQVRARVAAIAVSAQGGSVVLADDDHTPLGMARSWMDRRADAERERLVDQLGADEILRRTGWPAYGAYTAVQLMNMRESDSSLLRSAAHVLGAADFVNSRLVGRAVADTNSQGITQLLDVRAHTWDPVMCETVGVDAAQLPRLSRPGDVLGTLSGSAAAVFGLGDDVVVAAGGHDQYCAALGAGVVADGDLLISTGTAWVTLGITARPVSDQQGRFALGSHVVPDVWGQFGSFRNGGVCLDWARGLLNERSPLGYGDVITLVEAIPPGADGLTFYPFFDGTTIPERCDDARGAFLDLETRHGPAHLLRAVMEGVVFQQRAVLDAYRSFVPHVTRLVVLGGATLSTVWTQMLADVLEEDLEVLTVTHGACIGAAILAGVGAGLWSGHVEASASVPRVTRTVSPSAASPTYSELARRHRESADALLSLYRSRRTA